MKEPLGTMNGSVPETINSFAVFCVQNLIPDMILAIPQSATTNSPVNLPRNIFEGFISKCRTRCSFQAYSSAFDISNSIFLIIE